MGGASLREDILAAAGVSAGSFYHQFAGKEDLLLEILRHDGAGVIQALQKRGTPRSVAPDANPRIRLLHRMFDLTEQNPEFVKIYVREFYSDSAAVRREIRRHRNRTIDHTRIHYDALRDTSGLPLDTHAIATFLTVQIFAIVNFYLDFPKKERASVRAKLIRSTVQMGTGGIYAMRTDEAE